MATKQKVGDGPRKGQPQKPAKPETVSVGKKIRDAFLWFEHSTQAAKEKENKRRREDEKKLGPQLAPEQITALVDEQEKLQQEINPKLDRIDAISAQLKAHWGHTGVTEYTGTEGKALVSLSYMIALDQNPIRTKVTPNRWVSITERVIAVRELLEVAMVDTDMRKIVQGAIVAQLKVSVTPPSSRRPRSGKRSDVSADEEVEE